MGRKELRLAEAAGVSFLYTSCTKVCSISCAVFSKLQALWGGRLASAAMRITMTLDPVTGIPARMQRQAEQFKAGPGRVDPTGDKPEMDSLLEGLGAYFPDFRDHPPIARVGEGKKGAWKRVDGLVSAERLLTLLDELESMQSERRG